MKFSIPFNGESNFIEVMDQHLKSWERIASIYVAPNPIIIGSGRKPKIGGQILEKNGNPIFDSALYDRILFRLMDYMASKNIEVILLLNAASLPQNPSTLLDYLHFLYYEKNLTGAIVASEEMIDKLELKKEFPNLKLHNSVYMGIKTLDAAKHAIDKGIDVFLIMPEFNRYLDEIIKYKNELGVPLKIMANEGCRPLCNWREEHHVHVSDYSIQNAVDDLFFDQKPDLTKMKCRNLFNVYPELIFKSPWIPPEQIHKYENCVEYVKIVGRSFNSHNLVKVINSYISGAYSGDLRDLIEAFKHIKVNLDYSTISESIWKHFIQCNNAPGNCDTCRNLVLKFLQREKRRDLNLFDDTK